MADLDLSSYDKKRKKGSGNYNAAREASIDAGMAHVARRDARGPVAAPSPVSRPAEKPLLTPRQEQIAQRAVVKDFEQAFGKIDTKFAEITPLGAIANAENMTHSRYVALTTAYNQMIQYFSQTVGGDEYLANYILAMGLTDDQQRQSTLAVLQNIINGGPLARSPSFGEQQAGMIAGNKPAFTSGISAENFGAVVANPSQFEKLSLAEQQTFIQHARDVIDYDRRHGQQSAAMSRALDAIATGDLGAALNPKEVADLHKWVNRIKADPDKALSAGLGSMPKNIQLDGNLDDIITIDPEWAERHPAKAAAEHAFLQQQFPTAEIRYGGGGIAAAIFNDIGRPLDALLSVPSAIISENVELTRKVFDNADPKDLERQRDTLSAKLATLPPGPEKDELLNEIAHLDDRIGTLTDTDPGFQEQVDKAFFSNHSNVGFSENIVQSSGLLPGDKGYEAAMAATMLAAQFADPLNYITGGAEGVKAAATIPKVVAETGEVVFDSASAVRGLVAKAVYKRLALTPEEYLVSQAGLGNIDRLAEGAKVLLGEENGRAKYSAFLQNFMPDENMRLLMVEAGDDPQAIKETLEGLMSGYTEGSDLAKLVDRRARLAERINEGDRLRADMRAADVNREQLDDLTRRIDEVEARGTLDSEGNLRLSEEDEIERAALEQERMALTGRKEGYSTFAHQTDAKNAASIREKGIQARPDKAEESGRKMVSAVDSDYAAEALREGRVGYDRRVIEFRAPDEAVMRTEADTATVKFAQDIPAEDILAIHDPGAAERFAHLEATREADLAELVRLENVMKGKTTTAMPLNFADLEEMRKNGSGWVKAIAEIDHDLGTFPTTPASFAARLPLVERAQELLSSLKRAFQPAGNEGAEAVKGGLERTIFLPGTTPRAEEYLVDFSEASRVALYEFGRTLQIPKNILLRHMGAWDELARAGDANAAYKWLHQYFNEIVTLSPKIPKGAKPSLLNLWNTTLEEAGSDFINIARPGEVIRDQPLGFVLKPDETGALREHGLQVFSADMLSQGVQLPPLDQIMAEFYPKLHTALNGQKLTKLTSYWKKAVLLAKLPSALPLRIMGELAIGRMGGFDLASLTNWGIAKFFRSVRGTGEFAELANAPDWALGSLLRESEGVGTAVTRAAGLGPLRIGDGADFWRALSGRLAHYHVSPEVKYALNAETPEEFRALAKAPDAPQALKNMLPQWSRHSGGLDEMLDRFWAFTHENIIGSGPFAEDVKQALRTGKLADGTELGTAEFASRMSEEASRGRYFTGMSQVHGKWAGKMKLLEQADDRGKVSEWLFKWFYAKPEMLLRRGAYRQWAKQNLTRLRAMGYPDDVAMEIARSTAARTTAAHFFKIGAHTSGEYWMRNISPFFPAWREVTDTWLLKVPERIGGGSRILGMAYLAHKADLYRQISERMGLITRDPYGGFQVNMPFLNPVVDFLVDLGGGDPDVQYKASIPFDSFFGVVPFPDLNAQSWTDTVSSLMPGLGGSVGSGAQLAAARLLDSAHEGWQRDLYDLMAPFGVGTVGATVSNFYTAAALRLGMDPVAPWDKLMSEEWKEQAINSSIDDALRRLQATGKPQYQYPMFDPSKLDDPQYMVEYRKQFRTWQENMLTDAEHEAAGTYLMKTTFGAFMPFSATPTTEEGQSITAIWSLINGAGLPEQVREDMMSPMLAGFQVAYPQADWFTTGKIKQLGPESEQQSISTEARLQDMFEEGLIEVRNPEEYLTWATGMTSYKAYLDRKSAIYNEFDYNPVDYLLNGSEARGKLAEADQDWQLFLTNDKELHKAAGDQSFSDMFGKVTKNMSLQDIASTGLVRQLPLIQDAVEEGTYSDLKTSIYESIKDTKNKSDTPEERRMWGTLDKYYSNVADPYYSHLDKLYSEVNRLPDSSPKVADVYDRIREFANKTKPRSINGIKMPTPEAVAFLTKAPEEREQWAVDKLAQGHPEWLTDFQQKMLGLGGGPKVKKFTDFVSEVERDFKEQWPDYYARGWTAANDNKERRIKAEARKMGLGTLYDQWTEPLFIKVQQAGLARGPGWQQAVHWASTARREIEGAGLVLDTSSTRAQGTQKWLMDNLEKLYQADDKFAEFIDNASTGLSDEQYQADRKDTFWQIFLDGYGSAPSYLL